MVIPSLYIGGQPFYSRLETINLFYEGGLTLSERTINGTLSAQRSSRVLSRVTVSVYPTEEIIESLEQEWMRVLTVNGVINLELPDGRCYPVELADRSFRGIHPNVTDEYPIDAAINRNVVLADLFMGGEAGEHAYSQTHEAEDTVVYLRGTADPLLEPWIGMHLTNDTSAWGYCYLFEDYFEQPPRPSPTLVCRFSLAAGAIGAIGLMAGEGGLYDGPLDQKGIGIRFDGSGIYVIGWNDTDIAAVGELDSFEGMYQLILTARHNGSRIELWKDGRRVYFNPTIPFRMPVLPMVAGAHVYSGTVTLHHWWVLRG